MRPLKLQTFVWGRNHIDWFEQACIRSLCWPKNKEALKEATWCIFTRPQDMCEVKTLAEKVGVKEVKIFELHPNLEGMPRQMGLIMLEGLLHIMDSCIEQKATMLTIPPDSIFGEGTIPNILKMGRFGNTCVAVPHGRVSSKVLLEMKDPMSNAELVAQLLKHPHQSWETSEIGHPRQSSFVGGIAWDKMDEGLYSVTHRLPTPYLANFTPDDRKFFTTIHEPGFEPVYGQIDHLWPSLLIKQQRQRTPGSSDIACILEVTKDELNVPALHPVDPLEPDKFWRTNAIHNESARQYSFTMRAA